MRNPLRLFKLILIFMVLLTSSMKPLLVDAQNTQSNSVTTVRYHLSHVARHQTTVHYTKLSKAFKNNDREKNDIVYFSMPTKKENLNADSVQAPVVVVAVPAVVTFRFQVLRI